ncbi:MAG: hypothetical protein ACRCXX_10210 [Cetobacterium sp.]|uniref:hypothetical protein n=1 Tax=Cetobacterium sp. TaxID=2071632 RepID=UPI003F2F4752
MPRLVNTVQSNLPLNNYTECNIDVDPMTNRGFVVDKLAYEDDQDDEEYDTQHRLMLKCDNFLANNSPLNVATRLNNTKFWVWDNWTNDDMTFKPSSVLWQQTFKEYNLDDGFYPDQTSLINGMKGKTNGTVDFSFNAATQLLTYTGTKPLLLPISDTFDPAYYKARPNVIVVDSVNTVTSNIAGIELGPEQANFYVTKTVNGQYIKVTYSDPDYKLDLLAVKLGFLASTNSTKSNIVSYFGYPIVPQFGDESAGTAASEYLNNNTGSIALLLYPLAKGNSFGNMYGAMANINIVSPDIDSVIPGENSIAKIALASYPALTQITYHGNQWYPLTNSSGLNKYFKFSLVDDYGRPYVLNVGPPSIQCSLELRSSY